MLKLALVCACPLVIRTVIEGNNPIAKAASTISIISITWACGDAELWFGKYFPNLLGYIIVNIAPLKSTMTTVANMPNSAFDSTV